MVRSYQDLGAIYLTEHIVAPILPERDRPAETGATLTPAQMEAGERALLLSCYSNEFEPTTAAQAVREVAVAMGLAVPPDGP